MNQPLFEEACGRTLLLLKARMNGEEITAVRMPELPFHPNHLLWMLIQAPLFYFEGKVEKANRWLGFVQGVLASVGVDLEDLKRANMPEGETFDGERL